MSSGAEFQARVEARLSINMLAEMEAPTLFGRAAVTAWIAVEAAGDVDDVMVGFSDGGVVYLQCKKTVDLDKPAKLGKKQVPLGSAIEQFVRQYHAGVSYGGAPPRRFALDLDRLVLAVGSETSAPVRVTLRKLLDRMFHHPAGHTLDEVAHNAEDRRVLTVLLQHVRLAWRTVTQRDGTDAQILEFLRFVRVEEFTVEEGQEAEQTAEQILRSSVLADPTQARLAWSRLIEFWLGSQSKQRSTDRAGLVRVLLPKIRTKAARSYQADIEKLRAHSRRVAERLKAFGRIAIAGTEVELDRAYGPRVRTTAEAGNLLLTGRPGAGKSGIQHRLLAELEAEGRDYVALAAQDHSAASLVGLRAELDLEHDVAEVLSAWPGEEPAFLLIDALDAARGDPAARTLRQLIREVGRVAERWRVVASIREYDLRYGAELRQLFTGPPVNTPQPALPDERLQQVRHLVVGDFSDAELAHLAELHPGLHAVVESARPELRKLIANPFNLSIAATLIESGRMRDSIRSITTQVELLDAYWSARVEEGGSRELRHARSAILRTVAEEMIRVRALRAAHAGVIGSSDSAALDELLRSNVLAEWQRRPGQAPENSTLVFAHHRIFDYAVERALLRGTRVGPRLADDPQFVLFARPSIEMHFEHLWDASGPDRADFWAEILDVCGRPDVKGIAALVGPGIAARRARSPIETKPLLDALLGPDSGREAAKRALEYTLRSLLPGAGLGVSLVGADAGPWAAFLEQVSRATMPLPILWTVALVLDAAAREKEAATPEQAAAMGTAARRLLDRAWANEPRSAGFVRLAIKAVLNFFHASPAESTQLLRNTLAPDHISRHGYEELRFFSDQVPELAARDPEFTRDLYASAFSLEPPPEIPTSLGGGPLFSLTSNAAQDLGISLYGLTRGFPKFLQRAPVHAAASLIPVVRFHGEHAHTNRRPAEETFDFHGEVAWITADYKGLWCHKRNADEASKLLQQLQAHLVKLANEASEESGWRGIIDYLVRENDRASLWAVLLRAGAQAPETLGEYLKPLLWATPLLGGVDTKAGAGEFLAAMGPRLNNSERERVERVILAIDDSDLATLGLGEGRLREALLLRLGEPEVLTPEARALLEKWRAAGAAAETDDCPIARSRRGESEEERWGRLGIPDDEANRDIRDLGERALALAEVLRNRRAGAETALREVAAVLPALEARLASAEADGVHPAVRMEAYDGFVALCANVADDDSFSCDDALAMLVRPVLLEASRDPRPHADEEPARHVKDWPMLSSRKPRGYAAKGLCALAGHAKCAGPEVVEAVERLAADPVDEVRVRVARGLDVLARTEEAVAWRIAGRFVETEPVPGIVAALMISLGYMLRMDADRVAELAVNAHQRLSGIADAPETRWLCVDVLNRLYLLHGHERARDYLFGLLAKPDQHAPEASHLVQVFREGVLTQGDVEHADAVHDRLRERFFEVLTHLARCAGRRLAELLEERGAETDRETWRERVDALARVLDGIGLRVYAATGRDEDYPVPPPSQLERFYRESAELMTVLADVALPNLTHHLVETLERLIPVDPRGVFLRIAGAIRSGAREGYHYDSMAEDLFIRLVKRYLADHPNVFQEFEDCRDELLDLLDLFLRIGSTEAMRLTYGLRELFL